MLAFLRQWKFMLNLLIMKLENTSLHKKCLRPSYKIWVTVIHVTLQLVNFYLKTANYKVHSLSGFINLPRIILPKFCLYWDHFIKMVETKLVNSANTCIVQIDWRPPSLSELTPYQISLGLTYLGSESSKYLAIFNKN